MLETTLQQVGGALEHLATCVRQSHPYAPTIFGVAVASHKTIFFQFIYEYCDGGLFQFDRFRNRTWQCLAMLGDMLEQQ